MFEEEFVAISPIDFFQVRLDCVHLESETFQKLNDKQQKKYLLPDLSHLCADEAFAEVFMGWNKEGLEFVFQVKKKVEDIRFPDITQGDSVEIFIDTRDVKTSGYNTRFCHHFFFLPESVEGYQKGEKTHFRTEDAHELCDPSELKLKSVVKSNGYLLYITVPKQCLNGYDPDQFDRFGFTYRINRPRWQSQHFCVVTEEYQLEQQPSLWSSVRMVK